MTTLENLFSEGSIGSISTKNRVVMPAMVLNYADPQGRVTNKYAAHMDSIARGGVGTMLLEASFVDTSGKGFHHQIGVHDDDCIEGLRRVFRSAHAHDVRIGVQLFHAGRQTTSDVTGTQPLGPSELPCPLMQEMPKALGADEIQEIVEAFGAGARRARDAGADLVEIHGAHGYLIAQFLSPYTNKRDDRYGGSFENRLRFLEEVYHGVRASVGDDFPVIVRLSGEEWVPGELTINDTSRIARRLEEIGADALHITAGNYASYAGGKMITPMAIPDAPLAGLAEEVKATVSIPVIAVDKIRSPELADRLIAENVADYVAIGRSLLADPEWPNKARLGHAPAINSCITCNQGCISRLFRDKDVWCTVNPECSREQEFAARDGEIIRKVLIAGGGPAGMSAAREAARRGHHVILCERDERLGGQLFAAAAAPHRDGWTELRRHLTCEAESPGIDLRLATPVDADLVRAEAPDLVLIATGSHEVMPDIPGIGDANAMLARDLLERRTAATGDVVVAGGGCTGAQTAEYLAEQGHAVTVVEQTGTVAEDAPNADRALLIERLERLDVRLMTDTTICGARAGAVTVDGPAGQEDLTAHTVVVSLGARSEDSLSRALDGLDCKVVVIGDAKEPRKVTEAMVEGATAVLDLH